MSNEQNVTTEAEKPATPGGWRQDAVEWAKTIVGAIAVYLAFTTVAFANYRIPSESMVPHLEVGDRVVVSKFAYGYSRYSLPFDLGKLLPASTHRLFQGLPKRGDVVVFVHPMTGEVLIKRAVGLPGDTIEVRNGLLWINGVQAPLTGGQQVVRQSYQQGAELAQRYEETLPDGYRHTIDLFPNSINPLDNFGPYVVPEGHIFFMGDNRDNSKDSRAPDEGPAPIENLIGRAEVVYWVNPFPHCGGDTACPMPRWLKPLHH
ncbi:MAG: signal peptidase I [Terricaulis sp.]